MTQIIIKTRCWSLKYTSESVLSVLDTRNTAIVCGINHQTLPIALDFTCAPIYETWARFK